MGKKIAVLLGGRSSEREISLKSGKAVLEALRKKGYDPEAIDTAGDFIEDLHKVKPDVVFLALHGPFGEDGTIQGLLEIMGLPYTGPGVAASAIGMNKILTKKILSADGIPTPPYKVYSAAEAKGEGAAKILAQVSREIGLPVVVKAPTQGSSIGVCFVHKEEDFFPALAEALKYDQEILVEKFLPGQELTAPVIGNDNPQVLPLIEIVSKTGVYDFTAKYTVGMSDHLIPARVIPEIAAEIEAIARRVYLSLGCRGFSRIDFLVSDNKPYVLEINTIPGLTETSLFPDAARAVGIDFPALIEKLIELALEK